MLGLQQYDVRSQTPSTAQAKQGRLGLKEESCMTQHSDTTENSPPTLKYIWAGSKSTRMYESHRRVYESHRGAQESGRQSPESARTRVDEIRQRGHESGRESPNKAREWTRFAGERTRVSGQTRASSNSCWCCGLNLLVITSQTSLIFSFHFSYWLLWQQTINKTKNKLDNICLSLTSAVALISSSTSPPILSMLSFSLGARACW